MTYCVHEQVNHIRHWGQSVVIRNGIQRLPYKGFGTALAGIMEVEQMQVVFYVHPVDGHLGMFSVDSGIRVAQQSIALFVVVGKTDVDIAAGA